MSKNSIERLRQYVSEDEIYSKYRKEEITEPNDFEMYCIEHCEDIEWVLARNTYLEKKSTVDKNSLKYQTRWYRLRKFIFEMVELMEFHIADNDLNYGDNDLYKVFEAKMVVLKQIKDKIEKLEVNDGKDNDRENE